MSSRYALIGFKLELRLIDDIIKDYSHVIVWTSDHYCPCSRSHRLRYPNVTLLYDLDV